MNNEIPKIQEKGDARIPTTSLEALLPNDFNVAVNSLSEILDVKTILHIQSNSENVEKNFVNNTNSTHLKVKQINISCCELTQIPEVIFSLKYLTTLNLSNNFLENLPKEIGNLCNLLSLKLSGNKLKYLPKSLKNVHQLNYLDLSCNHFSEIPDVLYYSLRTLTILDLSCNKITTFNEPPGCLNKLVALSLSDNFLKQLPVWIFDNLCQLQFFDISLNQVCMDNKIANYSKTGIYESLQLLNMENCNLSCKSLEILSVFKKLKILHLGNGKVTNEKLKGKNYMGNFKSNMFLNFQEIINLHLQSVQIATLPTDFIILKNIEVLDLSGNLLSWLPECFCELNSLRSLYLTSNQLLFLPVNIGKLVNLKQIHLGNNKLCQIPESFYSLTNLEYIDLYNNEIERVESRIFKEKNLKGIDLGLNCLLCGFCENTENVEDINMLYCCLRDTFRKHFCHVESRSDLQMTNLEKGVNETSSDSHSFSNQHSTSSLESELLSDSEDLFQNLAEQNYNEDDDWDSHKDEEDELFDPNEVDLFEQLHNQWAPRWIYDFQNNFCPANYHASSVMRTYIKNFKLASENETVEEGQFDSD